MLLAFCLGSWGFINLNFNWGFWLLALGFGIGGGLWGVISNLAYIRFFGPKHLGEISGFSTSITVFASAIGPAAFSLGVFSMHEREDRNESIRDVVLFSLATPVMIMVSFYALEGVDEHIIALSMLFAAGTFLYVSTVDTLPDIHNPETCRQALLNVLIGVALMLAILLLVGDLHAH